MLDCWPKLQLFEPPNAAPPIVGGGDVLLDNPVRLGLVDDDAGDEQGADGAGGLFQQPAAFDLQV